MKETKQLMKVNNSMLKKVLLKAGAVILGAAFIISLAGCPNGTGPGSSVPEYKPSAWGSLEIGTRCGDHNRFNCFAGVASSMGTVNVCHPTDECIAKTENVYLNALYYGWNMVEQGKGVAHDVTRVTTNNSLLQRYMGQGYQAFPCTGSAERGFAAAEADAWNCSSLAWGGGQLGY